MLTHRMKHLFFLIFYLLCSPSSLPWKLPGIPGEIGLTSSCVSFPALLRPKTDLALVEGFQEEEKFQVWLRSFIANGPEHDFDYEQTGNCDATNMFMPSVLDRYRSNLECDEVARKPLYIAHGDILVPP